MPGKRSLELNQYYGHVNNKFWPIMFEILKEEYSNEYEIKKQLLIKNNIALWDVLKACVRESSSDSDILMEEANDFRSFFQNHPTIQTIFFNGNNARSYFGKFAIETELPRFVLPSTSPANTHKGFNEKLNIWKSILKYL